MPMSFCCPNSLVDEFFSSFIHRKILSLFIWFGMWFIVFLVVNVIVECGRQFEAPVADINLC